MTPGAYKITPYNFTFSPVGYADIEARSARYLQFRVTDQDDNPAPDLLPQILLKKPGGDAPDVGMLNYGTFGHARHDGSQRRGDARFDGGVTIGATAPFEVSHLDPKTNQPLQTLTATIRIVKPKGFWTQ